MSPNFSRDFELSIDASDTGIGAMLCQKDDLGESHPVAFFSKKLNEPQRKYSTIEKETLALIAALNHFEVYVTSNPGPLVIYTDYNPLKFLNRFQNKNQRLTRWSLFLQEYDLDIRHIKGKDNIIPDVLSRILDVVFHHDYALIHFFSFSFQSVWCAWQLWCLFLNPEVCVIPLGRAGAAHLFILFCCYSLLELLLSKKGHNHRVFFIFLLCGQKTHD